MNNKTLQPLMCSNSKTFNNSNGVSNGEFIIRKMSNELFKMIHQLILHKIASHLLKKLGDLAKELYHNIYQVKWNFKILKLHLIVERWRLFLHKEQLNMKPNMCTKEHSKFHQHHNHLINSMCQDYARFNFMVIRILVTNDITLYKS